MDCEQTRRLLDAYLDGELDLVRNLDIEQHLATCSECSIIYRNRQTLRTSMNQPGIYYEAPSLLQKRIQRSLKPDTPLTGRIPSLRWLMVAAMIVVVFVAGTVWTNLQTSSDPLAQEALASHLRSLMANHLEDVASTDQHTVKPWFDGKLDFSPPVVDLASDGFPLIGGRLDYFDNRSVAALVYQRKKHIINLFIWPASTPNASAVSSATLQGYQLLHWTALGMNFWAVSDVSAVDLQTFVQRFQAESAATVPEVTPS